MRLPHVALHSHLPRTHTRVLKHTLRATYLVALWLRWHRFCSGSCYKTTLSVCVAADAPGFGATGGTRRHFYLGGVSLFLLQSFILRLPVYFGVSSSCSPSSLPLPFFYMSHLPNCLAQRCVFAPALISDSAQRL